MHCICCGSDNCCKRGTKQGYSIYICKNCRFQFVYPLPLTAELEEFYKAGMHRGIEERVKNAVEDIDNNKNHPHRDWFLKILKKAVQITGKKKLKILEIGSSIGSFVHIANKMGHDATGTEISEETAKASQGIIQGQIIYTGNKRYNELFPANSYDLIYMEHVLEHLTNPDEIIQQIQSLLNNNGILVISVPNQKSWMAKLYGIYWDWMSPPLHLQYFNKDNLTILLQKNNLKVIKNWTGEYYFRSIYQFFTTAMLFFRIKQVLNIILRTKFKTEYKFDYLYKYPGKIYEIFKIMPYYILYPLIIIFSYLGLGNDLTLIVKKSGNLTN